MKFNYTILNEPVTIVPMRSLFCKRIMDRFAKRCKGVFKPNLCYYNALVAARWLKEWGFDVEVVDGVLTTNDNYPLLCKKMGLAEESRYPHLQNNAPIGHRWCKKGNRYFDPTIEGLFGMEYVRAFDYKGMRVFDDQTLIAFANTIRSTFRSEQIRFVSSISGCTYKYDGKHETLINWGYIDDNGNYIAPEKNPFEELSK